MKPRGHKSQVSRTCAAASQLGHLEKGKLGLSSAELGSMRP